MVVDSLEDEDVDIYTVKDLKRDKADDKRKKKWVDKQRKQKEKEIKQKRKAGSLPLSAYPSPTLGGGCGADGRDGWWWS